MNTSRNIHARQSVAIKMTAEFGDGYHSIGMTVEDDGGDDDTTVFVCPEDFAKFRRAVDAFNAALAEREPFAPSLATAAE